MADSDLLPAIEPMLAKLSPAIPGGPGWLYEPKWDGFRCIVYFDDSDDSGWGCGIWISYDW